MFCLNHRSIKVTLFSEIHIKIISKISLTYHQIAFTESKITTVVFISKRTNEKTFVFSHALFVLLKSFVFMFLFVFRAPFHHCIENRF